MVVQESLCQTNILNMYDLSALKTETPKHSIAYFVTLSTWYYWFHGKSKKDQELNIHLSL